MRAKAPGTGHVQFVHKDTADVTNYDDAGYLQRVSERIS
jgi:hypothetical protein